MFLLTALLALSCSITSLLDYSIRQWKPIAAFHLEDAYKWLFQATQGGEHLIDDKMGARIWLEREWSGLSARKTSEPVWEPLCSDGSIGRINLRPYRSSGGSLDALLKAFIAGSREFRAEKRDFIKVWTELGERLRMKPIGNLKYSDWQVMDRRMKSKDYPAAHHSSEYTDSEHPAYRVTTGREMERLLRTPLLGDPVKGR